MSKSHIAAAFVIVLSTSLLAPGGNSASLVHVPATYAGSEPHADPDAPLIIKRK